MGIGNNSLTWRKIDEGLNLQSENLRELLALWESRCTGGQLPGRKNFEMEELARFGGRIALVDVELSPERFRFRLIGSRITGMLGRDSTGLYLDELYSSEKYDLAVEGYRRCLAHRRPVPARGRMVHANKDFLEFEAIDLPLASDGWNVDMIMKGAEYYRGAAED